MKSSLPLTRSLGGIFTALLGWSLVEPFFQDGGSAGRIGPANAFFFPVVMGAVTAFLTAVDPERGHRSGVIGRVLAGFGVAFAVTYLIQIPSHVLLAYLSPYRESSLSWDLRHTGVVSPVVRGFTWACTALAAGISQGIVTRNPLPAYGTAMGAMLGGFMAGLLFDPLHVFLQGGDAASGWISRAVGTAITGGSAGFIAGVMADVRLQGAVEIVSGALSGQRIRLGLSPYLPDCSSDCHIVSARPSSSESFCAFIQKNGFHFEIRSFCSEALISVNDRIVLHNRSLVHGDRIRIGETEMIFSDKELSPEHH